MCQALWRARAENDRRRRIGQEFVWLSLDLQACFDTVLREVGLAASEGLGVDPKWGERWKALWEDLGARIKIQGQRGAWVKWERGVVQRGIASPGLFVILSLLFVRGNKQLGLDIVQIVVADDGLVGVPRKDLQLLVRAVMSRYTDYYMDIAPGKTKPLGATMLEQGTTFDTCSRVTDVVFRGMSTRRCSKVMSVCW